jgi:hypothetical protein
MGFLHGNISTPEHSGEALMTAFIILWYATCQNQMVYDEKLLLIAQESGLPLDDPNFRPQTVLGSILKEMIDKTFTGFTVRSLGGGAYKLEGSPSRMLANEAQSKSQPGVADGCSADTQAMAYVRSQLKSHAALYCQGRAEDFTGRQIGFIRSEANQRFGAELVNDDVEGVWVELVDTS